MVTTPPGKPSRAKAHFANGCVVPLLGRDVYRDSRL
jgi:hypothetical protein